MNKQDMVLGHMTRYDWLQIQPWVISLEKSGFKGVKAIVVYEAKQEVVDKLKEHGFAVFCFNHDPNRKIYSYSSKQYSIVVDRFYHTWNFLKKINEITKTIENIIMTDVKDVIFQTNPSEWLQENNFNDPYGRHNLLVGSESLIYKDEAWGNDNLEKAFPMLYHYMADKPIYNAGTFAGKAFLFGDFCLQVFLASIYNPVFNPDQAAFNALLTLEPWKSQTHFAAQDEGWACQCGTTVDPNKITNFRKHLLSPEPKFEGGQVKTSTGKPFVLVHQYDRTEWKAYFEGKFKE